MQEMSGDMIKRKTIENMGDDWMLILYFHYHIVTCTVSIQQLSSYCKQVQYSVYCSYLLHMRNAVEFN